MASHRTAFVYRQRIRITSLTSPLFSSIPGALLQLLRRYGFPAAKMKLPCKADRCNIDRTLGDYHIARKASFEAKAWEQIRSGFGGPPGCRCRWRGGAAAAAGAPVADALTHNAVVTHKITLGEEEIADVSLATSRDHGDTA